jgi:site-specific DNA-methyltransferase (adenine-specific)
MTTEACPLDIDPEFAQVLPTNDYEKKVLEENLIQDGCRDPLVVWRGQGKDGRDLLVDGHTRYSICQAHNIPFQIQAMDFQDRNAVIMWIIKNQIGRRNLNLFNRSVVALKLEDIISQQSKENQRLSQGRGKIGVKNSTDLIPQKTNEVLAKIADTSSDTIQKVKRLEKFASDELKAKLVTGEVSVHSAVHKMELKRREQKRNETPLPMPAIKLDDPSKEIINQIICADVLDGLKKIESGIVSLIITDPPWNAAINYAGHGKEADCLPYQDYLAWLKKIWIECSRVLTNGGRLVIACDVVRNQNQADKQKELRAPIFADLIFQMREIGDLKFRDRIIIVKGQVQGNIGGFGTYCSPANPNLRHDTFDLMVFCKNSWTLDPPSFDIEPDIAEQEFQEYAKSTWYIPPLCRNAANHPCPWNPELLKRVMKLYSYPTQIVLDPFAGTGGVATVALENNRRFICIEQSPQWCNFAKAQILKRQEALVDCG